MITHQTARLLGSVVEKIAVVLLIFFCQLEMVFLPPQAATLIPSFHSIFLTLTPLFNTGLL